MKKKRTFWTEEQLSILREKYADTPTAELMELTGRSRSGIFGQALKLGLKKSQEYLDKYVYVMDSNIGAAYRFPKGNVPANKGIPMSEEAYKKAAPTMFKKGQKPHNTQPKGTELWHFETKSDRKYLYRKIADRNWQPVHRIMWEETNGPIPAGHRLHFVDGNTENITLQNLELRTYAAGMQENSFHNYPEELKEVVMLTSLLTRKINKKTKQHGTQQN